MTEEITTTPTAQDAPDTTLSTEPTPSTPTLTAEQLQAELKTVRHEAAQRRVALKTATEELEALKKARQDAENATLTEQQKFKELAEKHEKRANELEAQLKAKELEVLRVRVAAEFGLNVPLDDESGETLADRLRGDTIEALRVDAQKLAKLFKKPVDADPSAQPEQPPQEESGARRPAQTSSVPGGPPVGRTDIDRKRDYLQPLPTSPIFDMSQGGATVNTRSTKVR